MKKTILARLYLVVVLLVSAMFASTVSGAAGDLDGDFNPGSGVEDGFVRAVALQIDGKIIIAGGFFHVDGVAMNRIARLNADGSVDSSFNSGSGANGMVYTSAVQADGKIIIGGDFSSVNGVARNRIARLNTDGSVDNSFNPGTGANSAIYTVVVQVDGRIVIGGQFTSVANNARNYIARLNANGSLDTGFNPGASSHVRASVVQPDGKILIGGLFTIVNGKLRNTIARLNIDGSVDDSFITGGGGISGGFSIAIRADGKIMVGGEFSEINGTAMNRIVRLHADGSVDSGFNPDFGANSTVYTIVVQADGKTIIGGSFTAVNGTVANHVARLNADGSLDSSFSGAGTNWEVYAAASQTDGQLVLGGAFTGINGALLNRIARIHTGDPDADGIQDAADAFPLDPAESVDTDSDGIGNNADWDDDGDSVPDSVDAEPLDPDNNTEIILPLDSAYKGRSMNESILTQ